MSVHLCPAITAVCVCTPQILFVWVNVNEPRNGRLMEYFRVRGFEAPLIRLVNMTDHVTYHLPSESLDAGTIKRFCQSYLEGRAKVDPASSSMTTGSVTPSSLTSCGSLLPDAASLRCRASRYPRAGTSSR